MKLRPLLPVSVLCGLLLHVGWQQHAAPSHSLQGKTHTTHSLPLLMDCLSLTQAAKGNCCQREIRHNKNKEVMPNYVKRLLHKRISVMSLCDSFLYKNWHLPHVGLSVHFTVMNGCDLALWLQSQRLVQNKIHFSSSAKRQCSLSEISSHKKKKKQKSSKESQN